VGRGPGIPYRHARARTVAACRRQIDTLVAYEVVVLEINPRIQSVTSLISMAELAAGILPSPLLHALAFLTDPPPLPTATSADMPPFGQLVRPRSRRSRTSGAARTSTGTTGQRWPPSSAGSRPTFYCPDPGSAAEVVRILRDEGVNAGPLIGEEGTNRHFVGDWSHVLAGGGHPPPAEHKGPDRAGSAVRRARP
jgi:hypothetical protein